MEQLLTRCPYCKKPFLAAASLLGRTGRCNNKECGQLFRILASEASTVSEQGKGSLATITWEKQASTGPERSREKAGQVSQWKAGDILLDVYQVQGVVGEGGMGVVHKVHHRGWNLDLAVKSPRAKLLHHEGAREDFEREAETWVNLGLHPHIVSCYYVRRIDTWPRLFIEYMPEGSLLDWIRKKRLYEGGPEASLERILDIAIQFAWGLHHAHEKGLVHQDVKPGNVLVGPNGVVKVTDFGLAKARAVLGEEAQEGQSILVSAGGMTPAYCSPEQVRRQSLSRRTDIWSWAVSILEMFNGSIAWSSGAAARTALERYLSEAPIDSIPRMPEVVVEVLKRCLERDPQKRPGNLQEVAQELREAYESLLGRPYPRKIRTLRLVRGDSLNNRAASLLDLGKEDQAEECWEKALQADPHHLESTYNLTLLRWRRGSLTDETLLSTLKEVARSHSDDWLPHLLLGQVLLEQGDAKGALAHLDSIPASERADPAVKRARAAAKASTAGAPEFLYALHDTKVPLAWKEVVGVRFAGGEAYSVTGLFADGRVFADGMDGFKGTLQTWDWKQDRCLKTFEGHRGGFTCFDFRPDTNGLAISGGRDGQFILWDMEKQDQLCSAPAKKNAQNEPIRAVIFNSTATRFLSGHPDGSAHLWRIRRTGGQYSFEHLISLRGHDAPVTSIGFCEQLSYLVTASVDGVISIWDSTSGECLRELRGHRDKIAAIAISEDESETRCLSGCSDGTLRLWNVETGQSLFQFTGHRGAVNCVAISSDGKMGFSGADDRTVRIWDLADGRCLHSFAAHHSGVISLDVSRNGKLLLTGGRDNRLCLWSIPEPQPPRPAPLMLSKLRESDNAVEVEASFEDLLRKSRRALQEDNFERAVLYLRRARSKEGFERYPAAVELWTSLYPVLRRRTLNGGWLERSLLGHTAAVNCIAFRGEGVLSASSDGTLRLWQTSTGVCLDEETIAETRAGQTPFFTFSITENGKLLVLGGKNLSPPDSESKLQTWKITSEQMRVRSHWSSESTAVHAIALTPDGRLALAAGEDRALRLWDVNDQHRLCMVGGLTADINVIALGRGGQIAASGDGSHVRLWDLHHGRLLSRFKAHKGNVTSLAFSANQHYLVTGGADGKIRLWEIASGDYVNELAGHTGAVTSTTMSIDNRFLVSGSADKSVKLWDVWNGTCLRTFEGHADSVLSVALAPDGSRVASAGADHAVNVWFLDWDLQEKPESDVSEEIQPVLETFLIDRAAARQGKGDEGLNVAIPRDPASWEEQEIDHLVRTIGASGLGLPPKEPVEQAIQEFARNGDVSTARLLASPAPYKRGWRRDILFVRFLLFAAFAAAWFLNPFLFPRDTLIDGHRIRNYIENPGVFNLVIVPLLPLAFFGTATTIRLRGDERGRHTIARRRWLFFLPLFQREWSTSIFRSSHLRKVEKVWDAGILLVLPAIMFAWFPYVGRHIYTYFSVAMGVIVAYFVLQRLFGFKLRRHQIVLTDYRDDEVVVASFLNKGAALSFLQQLEENAGVEVDHSAFES